ncbi:hypothetical protein VYU27_006457 [Nannochloropsis oceanica]
MDALSDVLRIVHCMQSCRNIEEVQEKGCLEVSNLCADPTLRGILCQAGIFEALLDAIRSFPSNLKILYTGLQAIGTFSSGSDEARRSLCISGAGHVLIECLHRFAHDQSVLSSMWGSDVLPQCEIIRYLCIMSLTHLLHHKENLTPLREAGTWEIVVQTMAAFPEEDELNLGGCRILAILAEELGKSNKAEMDSTVQRTTACQVVMAVSGRVLHNLVAAAEGNLTLTPDLSEMLVRGAWLTCCTLAALASISQEDAAQLEAMGASQQVGRMMDVCREEIVQEWGARALAEVALSLRGVLGGLVGAGDRSVLVAQRLRVEQGVSGCPAVLNAMIHCPECSGVQFACCYALANLAGECLENQLLFCAGNAAQAVSRALDKFPYDPKIQEWGARAYADLMKDCNQNQMAVMDAGGCSTLVQTLASFPNVPTVQFAACYAIVNLASSDVRARIKLGNAGACRHILKGMSGPCAVDPNVVEWACRALGDLASGNEENQVRIRLTGGCKQVVATLGQHSQNARVQFAGCYALTHLVAGNKMNQLHVAEAGGCEAIVRAILDFDEGSSIRTWGFRALVAMAATVSCADGLAEVGTLFEMVKVMKMKEREEGKAEGAGESGEKLKEGKIERAMAAVHGAGTRGPQ